MKNGRTHSLIGKRKPPAQAGEFVISGDGGEGNARSNGTIKNFRFNPKILTAILVSALIAVFGVYTIFFSKAATSLNCMSNPSACGYPDTTNTGVTPGTSLTPVSGLVTLSQNGQVYENKVVTGGIIITAQNVTLRNVKIKNTDPYYVISVKPGGSWDRTDANLTLDHVEIDMGNNLSLKGIAFSGFTLKNVFLHNGSDCVSFGSNITVQDSLCVVGPDTNGDAIPDNTTFCTGTEHFDGFEFNGGSNLNLIHNTVINPCPQTAAMLISDYPATTSGNITISDNLLSGGGYTLYCPNYNEGYVTVTNNRFARNYYPSGGYYGATTGCQYADVYTGNIWDDTGVLLDGQSAPPTPTCSTLQGDANNDNVVNISDISAILALFGQTSTTNCTDVTKDNSINISDISLVLSKYGNTNNPPTTSCTGAQHTPDGPDGMGGCWPGPNNTGVPAGTTLTTYTGPSNITTANTTITGKTIGCIQISAPGVTIRNSRITCNGSYVVYAGDGDFTGTPLLIEDSEIFCNNSDHNAVGEALFTLRRVDISGCENGGDINQKVIIEDSYIHDLYNDATTHTDGFQFAIGHIVNGSVVPGSLDVTIRHNTIFATNDNGQIGNAAIISNRGADVNILIEKNLMAGGGNTLYCEQGARGTNYQVLNNVFSRRFSQKVGFYGPSYDCSDETQSGNIYDNGQALVLP